ncbi:MAG TPA: hypothetical protein VGM82_18925 [Gemmatimonadaceae bacterium]|jgi:hypothetical protein
MGLDPVSGLCAAHDPQRRDVMHARRVAGGRAGRAGSAPAAKKLAIPAAPKTMDDAKELASWLTRAVIAEQIDARTCEAATKSLRQFQLVEEKRELLDEVKVLRAQVAMLKKASGAKRLEVVS